MTQTTNKQALQCLKAADALQKDIEKKHSSAAAMRALPPTRKRIQDSEGIFNDALRLEKLQRLLRVLAEHHAAGTIAEQVKHVTSRAAAEREVYSNQMLREMFSQMNRSETPAEKVQRLERQMLLSGIPGFFPTPASVADDLVSLVGPIEPGELIAEPGAGTGALIDAAFRAQPDIQVHYFERNYTLADFLQTKYSGKASVYQAGRDFTEIPVQHYAPKYSLILMNPPFENGQDADHVQRAYELLAPGGRIGAIVGAGVFYRSDKKAAGFREFLDETDAYTKDLPDGSFKSSGTGVNCKMVRIRKRREVRESAA